MPRGPYRSAISFVLSWNAICNAQTAPKINLPPIDVEPSAPLVEMPDCANCRGRVVARAKFLFPRASPTSGSDDNDSASVSPTSLSSTSSTTRIPSGTTSSSAATSSSSNLSIDIPTIHSPVPMVAGSLAGFIAILAAVLVIIVVRRRKQPMSRTTVRPPLPPFMDGTMLRDVEPDVHPTTLSHPRGRTQYAHPKSSTKRGSRNKYMSEDVELGRMDSDSGARGDTAKARHSSTFTGESGNNQRHSSGRTHPARPRVVGAHASASVNRYELDVLGPTAGRATTPPSYAHGQISPVVPHSASASPFSPNDPSAGVTDDSPFLPPSHARSDVDVDTDVQSSFSTPPIIRSGKGGGDLPPAYEDVR